jgi:nucleotide-binding universal stress UspA family protein
MKTILVPIDFSSASTRVCREAVALARATKARVLLVHVFEPFPIILYNSYAFNGDIMREAVVDSQKAAANRLERMRLRYSRGGNKIRAVQVNGLPVDGILQQAKASRATWIVMGSHGHGAVYDLVTGSTTQGVLRKAPCPVLVVPIRS